VTRCAKSVTDSTCLSKLSLIKFGGISVNGLVWNHSTIILSGIINTSSIGGVNYISFMNGMCVLPPSWSAEDIRSS